MNNLDEKIQDNFIKLVGNLKLEWRMDSLHVNFFFFKSWQEEACARFLKSLICCVSFSLKHIKDWNEIHDFKKTRFGMELNNNSE